MRVTFRLLLSILSMLLVGMCQPVTAQFTSASTIVGFSPSNTSTCPTNNYTNVTGVYNTGTIQTGTCQIPVTWNNGATFPSSLYAISCTVEGVNALGHAYDPQIIGSTRTPTGFTLAVSFYVNNVEISNDGNVPPGAIDLGHPTSGEQDWYLFGEPLGGARRGPIGVGELPTMYVDCIANNS